MFLQGKREREEGRREGGGNKVKVFALSGPRINPLPVGSDLYICRLLKVTQQVCTAARSVSLSSPARRSSWPNVSTFCPLLPGSRWNFLCSSPPVAFFAAVYIN